MWQQLFARTQRILIRSWDLARPKLHRAAITSIAFARGPLLAVLRPAFHTIAALVVLFLEWGWRPLEQALSRLSKYFVFARLEAWIATLPPYGALALFAAPAVSLFPLKLFAIDLFAKGHPALGVGLIIAAKVAGTAIVARIFILTQPQLMQIAWFRLAHDRFIPWKEAMFADIRASDVWRTGRIVRVEIKRQINRTWIGLKPQRDRIGRQTASLRADLRSWLANLTKQMR